jgi:hypothetical protein
MKNVKKLTVDQHRLKVLCEKIMERFDEIMTCLGIELKKQKNMYVGCCPVHGGDKYNALNIYHDGEDYVGNWKCRTQHCEKHFVGSAIGFIRGALSHTKYGWTGEGDQTVSFNETLQFIDNCLHENYASIEIDYTEIEKSQFVKLSSLCGCHKENYEYTISRQIIRNGLSIPAKYFIDRGYTAEVLDKYDVGLCENPADLLYNRIVVPIYNDEYTGVVANTSRSIFEQCKTCNTWHSKKDHCPSQEDLYKCAKWKHSYKFKKENHLYNYWFAKEHIHNSKVAILTESPGNIWRLEEAGIHVGLGTFGANLSDEQMNLLNQSGAMTIIVIGDNDKAGEYYNTDISERCRNIYNVVIISPLHPANDLGDMTIEQIKQHVLPIYTQCSKLYDNFI